VYIFLSQYHISVNIYYYYNIHFLLKHFYNIYLFIYFYNMYLFYYTTNIKVLACTDKVNKLTIDCNKNCDIMEEKTQNALSHLI